MAYHVQFAESVRRQIRQLPAHHRAKLLSAIEVQLVHEPLTETRNRKLLRPNPIAPWELRVGDLRAFYDVPAADVVLILAVGEKRGNRLFIAGEEIEL